MMLRKATLYSVAGAVLLLGVAGCSGADVGDESTGEVQQASSSCYETCDNKYAASSGNCDQAWEDNEISWRTYVDCTWSAYDDFRECNWQCGGSGGGPEEY